MVFMIIVVDLQNMGKNEIFPAIIRKVTQYLLLGFMNNRLF